MSSKLFVDMLCALKEVAELEHNDTVIANINQLTKNNNINFDETLEEDMYSFGDIDD